ncbi:MAG: hypothetical protein J2P37_33270 [Ktedonobacteraceae bacterium]|nr:hypothetical protein [Ktedonobacteraceae bacterium]
MDNRERFWDKFTARARKVLELAQEEARYFQHNTIGSEHLLLGLIREGESAAARVLASLDVTLEKVRQAVEEAKGRGNDIVQGEIGLTAHADMVIEMAVKMADRRQGRGMQAAPVVLVQSALCRAYLLFAADEAERRDGQGAPIKSEHLLLGLLREEKGIIADLLGDLGTSVETVRKKVLEAMSIT